VDTIEVEVVGPKTEQELLDSISPEPLPEVYTTVGAYAKRNDCSRSTALRDLLDLVEAGLLASRKVRVNRREQWIFF